MSAPRHRSAAVLGRPVQHSLSPVLHRAAYAALGLDWSYTAIDCGADDLPGVLAARAGWAGFSCTRPLKHAALQVAVEVAPVARAVGAANTLVPVADGWRADNTDVAGIVAALAEQAVAPRTVTVLGAGGTAQATLAALVALGVPGCDVLVRDPARAAELRASAARIGVALRVATFAEPGAALDADLVISTLPPRAADGIRTGARAVLDVVYAGWPTPFAAAAGTRGATVVSGAAMLLHQAAAQVSLMTGQDAPVPAMRSALAAAAPGCGI